MLEYARAVRARSVARRRMFATDVIDGSGLDAEDLVARLRDDEQFAALFETALDISVRSADEHKLRLLARVVAQAASDTASIDDAQLVAATIRELEPPHVRALVILADYKLECPDATGVASVIESMAGLRVRRPEKVTGSSEVLRARMGAATEAADAVSAALERLGLIWNNPPGFGGWGITGFGQRILDHLRSVDVKAPADGDPAQRRASAATTAPRLST